MQEDQEKVIENSGFRFSNPTNRQTEAVIVELYKPQKEKKSTPYLVRQVEKKFKFDLFNKNTYQKFKTKKLIRIWNIIKQIKVRGKKSVLFEEAKKTFLDFILKKSKFQKFDEEIFVYKYFFVAILEIRQKTIVSLYENDGELIKTIESKRHSYWSEKDLRNHLIKDLQYSRL